MTNEEIGTTIEKALAAVPEKFRERLENLAIVVEDSDERRERRGSDEEELCNLLGVYEGLPLSDFAGDRSGMLPDKITLFRDVILEEAEHHQIPVEEVVRHTVWHEIAHYFGFDEEGAQVLETKWEDAYRAS
jgi:predicted Zn-dependent protease with MMP-like domain